MSSKTLSRRKINKVGEHSPEATSNPDIDTMMAQSPASVQKRGNAKRRPKPLYSLIILPIDVDFASPTAKDLGTAGLGGTATKAIPAEPKDRVDDSSSDQSVRVSNLTPKNIDIKASKKGDWHHTSYL